MKTNFKTEKKLKSIFTGGKLQLNQRTLTFTNGSILTKKNIPLEFKFNLKESNLSNLEEKNNNLEHSIQSIEHCEDDLISCFRKEESSLILGLQNSLLKIYENSILLHEIKTNLIITVIDVYKSLTAVGSADSKIHVYQKNNLTHLLKGHSGVVTNLKFNKTILASAADDNTVRVWDLMSKKCLYLFDIHSSVVTSLCWDGDNLYSGGRDRLLCSWGNVVESPTPNKPITKDPLWAMPVSSPIEGLVFDKSKKLLYVAANDLLTYTTAGDLTHSLNLTEIIDVNLEDELLALTTQERNVLLYDTDFNLLHQYAGYNQEILQLAKLESNLVCVTNSQTVRIYQDENVSFLNGHEDIVLCCATYNQSLVTGSKDQSAIVWNYDSSGWKIQHRFKGHLGVVSAVAITDKIVLTASADKTVKCWDLSTGTTKFTFQAHDNDITSLNLSPNHEYFVTSSLDKTAKIWTKDGTLKTVLKGHKRGIWQAKFSPVDMLVCTSSTDKTMKLWGLDGSCVKTFEGHLNSVLNFEFMSLGTQLLSAGGDGLLKLWNIRDGECIGTFDDHEDRVWALTISDDEKVVYSGSSDGTVTVWRDTSEEDLLKKQEFDQSQIQKNQDLELFLKRKDYKNACILAFELDQPFRILNILKSIATPQFGTGSAGLDEYFITLEPENLTRILKYLLDWNTSLKNVKVVSNLLNLILTRIPSEKLLEIKDIKKILEGLVVYSKGHFEKVGDMERNGLLVDYTLERMEGVLLR